MSLKLCSAIVGLLLTSILSGCGGSSSSSQQATNGVYKDAGIVSGLQYKTATQSGVTDKDGTFRYVPGETVTFSVSNVVIGQVAGAGTITTFDLVGITPPTSSSGIPLNNPASKKFQEAANISLFLQTLDDDSNPTNGINIPSAANNVVANTPINFKTYADIFAIRLYNGFGESPQFKVFIGSCRTAKVWSGGKAIAQSGIALNNLYKGLGITPTVYLQSKSTNSDNSYFTYEYANTGLTSKRNYYDALSNLIAYYTFTYDANGNVTKEIYTNQSDPTSSINYAYTYDTNGNLIQRKSSGDSSPTTTVNIEYDINGNPTKSQTYTDDLLNNYTLYSYNTNGTLSSEVQYTAYGDLSYSQSFSYNSDLLITNMQSQIANNTNSVSFTFGYDANQNLISQTYTYDDVLTYDTTVTYDAKGNPTKAINKNGSGIIVGSSDYTWGAFGNLLSVTAYDENNQLRDNTVFTYDDNGNCISTKNTDGTSTNTSTFSYINQSGWGDILIYYFFGSPN